MFAFLPERGYEVFWVANGSHNILMKEKLTLQRFLPILGVEPINFSARLKYIQQAIVYNNINYMNRCHSNQPLKYIKISV